MSDTIESTVMAEPEASSSSAILTGMKRGFPIFLGYVPLGFAYGVLAVQNNIPAVYAVLFSLLVYAGAGQFIAVGLWGMGASVFSIVFTTFVINLRHVLMSAAVAPWFAPFTRFQQFIIGWGLTDEVFAMHSMAMATGEKARLPLVYAANFTSHSGWVLGTFIGAVAGDFLPDPKLFGLDYALPAMFLALLVPQCKERLYTLAAVLSALLSVILAMYDTGRWNVIIDPYLTQVLAAMGKSAEKPFFLLDSTFLKNNDGAIFQTRCPLEVKSVMDNNNDNNQWQGYARFGAGYVDWRFASVGNISTGTDLT